MKIFTKVIVDIATDTLLSAESLDYSGKVVEAKGGKPVYGKEGTPSVASQIVGSGEVRGPLTAALVSDVIGNPYLDSASREFQAAQSGIRGMYGARGLSGSGIAVKGEQDALTDVATKAQTNRANQLTGILSAASGNPNVMNPTMQAPRGFMGLK